MKSANHFRTYLKPLITASLCLCALLGTLPANARQPKAKNIVLVHGAFADGSGWKAVYDILTQKGYHVSIVQNPLSSLRDDVNATNSVLEAQDGPVVLVGHSWGGMVITEAGIHPKVSALVYVAAFVPDRGESAGQWVGARPVASEAGFTAPDALGYIYFEPSKFHSGFAADLPRAQSDFLNAAQAPVQAKCFAQTTEHVAWKTKPSYGIVATEDKALNPQTERDMYRRAGARITEVKASHALFLSQPEAVARVIIEAATNP